jgi:hypothetical protein
VTNLSSPPPLSTTHLANHLPLEPEAEPAVGSTVPAPDILAYSLFGGQGTARWRRAETQHSRDKVIVFKGKCYGIFDTQELMVLVGVPVHDLPPHLGTPADILRRYGCLPNSP